MLKCPTRRRGDHGVATLSTHCNEKIYQAGGIFYPRDILTILFLLFENACCHSKAVRVHRPPVLSPLL